MALVTWFLAGFNLADTIIAVSKKAVLIYTSERKSKFWIYQVTFLGHLKDHPDCKKFNLQFVAKQDEPTETYKKIWEQLHEKDSNPKVGMLLNDAKVGAVAESFSNFV